MPDGQTNNQGTGGDDAAAKAAADKAAADAAAAAAGAGGGAGDGEETVTIKKSDLKKIEEERDNYREGLLRKKADERNQSGEQGGGQGAANVIDEKKIGETAMAAATKALRDANERSARRTFLRMHPEYVDDVQWNALATNLVFRGGEITESEIVDRMDEAFLLHKRSTGKLDEYLRSEHERGVREGRIQGNLETGHGAGGAGDRNEGVRGAGILSEKGKEMARAMHVDPEKVAKIDPSKDNVIDVTKI